MPFISNLGPDTLDVMLNQPSTRLFVNESFYGAGTLVIAASRLSWVSEVPVSTSGNASKFSLEYKGVSIHAVSRDTSKFPHHCLYLMIDGDIANDVSNLVPAHEESMEQGMGVDDEEDDYDPVTEIRFVPSDPQQLDAMFNAMSDCQALHPDSEEDELSPDDGEEEDCTAEDAINGHSEAVEELDENPVDSGTCPTEEQMTTQGLATLRRLEAMLGRSSGTEATNDATTAEESSTGDQFEDADEEMES